MCLKNRAYSDFKYVLFCSTQKPTVVFSSLLFPHFDFTGAQLQSLGATGTELITFCSTPMKNGWGYLFAWHISSSPICIEFMKSLTTAIHQGGDTGDLLFRFIVSTCENLAISPEWWDSLQEEDKSTIQSCASNGASPISMIKPTYLTEGLEGISNWSFETVLSDME